jgi:UDPglucose 6-dehydrogenase
VFTKALLSGVLSCVLRVRAAKILVLFGALFNSLTHAAMKIAIIGTGYVGLVTGTCLAELGNDVICVDIDEAKIDKLNGGKIPFYEPGLEELVNQNVERGRLNFSTEVKEAILFADTVFSAVGTPPDKDHRADLRAVMAVAETFGQTVEKYTVFVNKSTIPIGTTDEVHNVISKELEKRGKSPREIEALFSVVDNPEFLREGAAVKDFLNPDRIVVGVEDERARGFMEYLYRPLARIGRPVIFTDIKSAELIKYASNAFLATKISFINEVANFCEKAGADVRQVARAMGLDSRIGPRFLHAGIGYGGSCFPKDVKALIQTGKEFGYEFKIVDAVEAVNAKQKVRIVEKLKTVYPDFTGLSIAIWGLTFKPRTDDMREAPSLDIIPKLTEGGAKVRAFDPVGMENARGILGEEGIYYGKDSYDVLDGADVLLILTEWDEFRGVDFEEVKRRLAKPVVIDGRNICDRKEMEDEGFNYVSIG